MVNPNINQFAQTTVQGQLDLQFLGSVVSARVSPNQATPLIAGQAVKIDTTADTQSQDGVLPVIALAANSDSAIGVIGRDLKDINFPANSRIQLAMKDSAMYMTANAAITRGSPVEYVIASNTVISWAGVNPILGYAYDVSAAQGDLIRVFLNPPAFTNQSVEKTLNVVATLAQINAGLVLIPGTAGKKITLTNYTARVAGNFATGTAVILESTNASPVLVTTLAEAGLTTGAVLVPASGNTTLGAGYAAPLGSGDGLQVVNSGSAQTAGTSITFTISYTQA
jgi:hypothetical protein